ncbi:MAG: PilZ domain-containing protein [Piscirickettsiaceae bacterium]|nr:PilZ domain-containing protein [Piscirickettsiaceae bacterium]
MADSVQKKVQNQAFLRQLEQQRLNKSCTRIIDLRGRVVGECQAYDFGGLTHYLDDRAYLLAKQLLDRFNGRYTIGVNEALLKTIKSLNAKVINNPPLSKPPSSSIQTITFDRLLQRKEPRIVFATPIEIRIADVLYHATTIDITTSAVRITLKRAFTLEEGDTVTVSFPEMLNESSSRLLSEISYTLLKVTHDDRRTSAILTRDRYDNPEITTWFDNWSKAHNSPENLDLEGELSNLASHYYLRLFCTTMNSPLFWLTSIPNEEPVRAFNLSPSAHTVLKPLRSSDQKIDFSLLPIEYLVKEKRDCLIIIYQHDNVLKNIVIPRENKSLVAQTLAWHSQQKNSHVLLMQAHSLMSNANDDDMDYLTDMLNDAIDEYMQSSSNRLTFMTTLVTLSDITHACQHLPQKNIFDKAELLALSNTMIWSGIMPNPTPLRHYIERKYQRFFIKTEVSLQFDGQSFSVNTHEVSERGLSLRLPGKIDIPIGSRVQINFIRWQRQAKKTNLDAVPFTVKNVQFWQQSTHLGLERTIPACAESINKFFVTNMEHNKEQLRPDTDDLQTSQETKILAPLLVQQFASIPFYLGMNNDNTRGIQAIATSRSNNGQAYIALLQAMSGLVAQFSELTIKLSDQAENSVSFGLYCYLDKTVTWQFTTDYELTNAAQKALFINRALVSEQYHFFQCTLSPIKSSWVEQEADLNQQLAQLRPHMPHKTTQLRKTLRRLFAIGELTDITDILEASYQ